MCIHSTISTTLNMHVFQIHEVQSKWLCMCVGGEKLVILHMCSLIKMWASCGQHSVSVWNCTISTLFALFQANCNSFSQTRESKMKVNYHLIVGKNAIRAGGVGIIIAKCRIFMPTLTSVSKMTLPPDMITFYLTALTLHFDLPWLWLWLTFVEEHGGILNDSKNFSVSLKVWVKPSLSMWNCLR